MKEVRLEIGAKTLLLFAICYLPSAICLFAAGEPMGFLNAGIGARAMGMGSAFTGLSDDSSAIYWNSAGLNQLRDKELMAMYGNLFVDTDYSFTGYVYPATTRSGINRTFGVGWLHLSSRGIEKTDESSVLDTFKMTDDAFFISAGLRIFHFISLGMTGKYIIQKIDDFSGSGLSFDLGGLLDMDSCKLGINFLNLVSTKIGGESIYRTLKVGWTLNLNSLIKFKSDKERPELQQNDEELEVKPIKINTNLAVDFGYTPESLDPFKVYTGAECWLADKFAVRMGWKREDFRNSFSFMHNFTMGGSLKFKHFQLHYGYILHEKLNDSHRFSMAMTL
ncbi:MAG: PorV/PorQ family protein [Elusimicrobia bacterium]|nr:PorV/PorQ family protein [Elusimicrobiota bacterium]